MLKVIFLSFFLIFGSIAYSNNCSQYFVDKLEQERSEYLVDMLIALDEAVSVPGVTKAGALDRPVDVGLKIFDFLDKTKPGSTIHIMAPGLRNDAFSLLLISKIISTTDSRSNLNYVISVPSKESVEEVLPFLLASSKIQVRYATESGLYASHAEVSNRIRFYAFDGSVTENLQFIADTDTLSKPASEVISYMTSSFPASVRNRISQIYPQTLQGTAPFVLNVSEAELSIFSKSALGYARAMYKRKFRANAKADLNAYQIIQKLKGDKP